MIRHDDVHEAKHAVRRQARDARCAFDAQTCAAHARSAAERLLSLPVLGDARVVMAYAASAEELDPAPAIAALHDAGKRVVLPRIEAPGVLGLYEVASDEELEPGALGIRQPHADAPRVAAELVDAVIVPGVAFDANGRRLGYGGGYYDRLLPRLREDCERIGFCYDEQLVDLVPVAEHDEHMHVIVTPTRVIRLREGATDS